MSAINMMSPDDIFNVLTGRLQTTNCLWNNRHNISIDEDNALFFKYYFDLFTAVESCLRGIVKAYCKTAKVGNALAVYAKPEDGSTPYFLNSEYFKAVTNESKILEKTSMKTFSKKYRNLITNLNAYNGTYLLNDYQVFLELYSEMRKSRNQLAHGLNSIGGIVNFSISTLDKFLFVFYVIHSYYKRIY